MTLANKINSLYEIIDKYDLFLIDQWGVMHSGQMGYSFAINCIEQLFKFKKKLIIISNSSKRKKSTINNLQNIGFNKNYFFEIITSGEMIWKELNSKSNNIIKNLGQNCYHLTNKGKIDRYSFQEGLEYNFVDNLDKADFILGCTTSPELTTLDYVPFLEKAISKNLPFICANPDFETVENTSNNKIICMGAVAELYKDFGGTVFIMGKPSIDIYNEATKKIDNLDKKKIIGIGDSIFHDIKGAINFGIDNLLITSGIHSSLFNSENPCWDENDNELYKFNFKPTYLCSKFQF